MCGQKYCTVQRVIDFDKDEAKRRLQHLLRRAKAVEYARTASNDDDGATRHIARPYLMLLLQAMDAYQLSADATRAIKMTNALLASCQR